MSIRLKDPVVTRSVPMTEETCTSLRKIRKAYQAKILAELGESIDLSFPVVIDFIIKDYMEKVYNYESESVTIPTT